MHSRLHPPVLELRHALVGRGARGSRLRERERESVCWRERVRETACERESESVCWRESACERDSV